MGSWVWEVRIPRLFCGYLIGRQGISRSRLFRKMVPGGKYKEEFESDISFFRKPIEEWKQSKTTPRETYYVGKEIDIRVYCVLTKSLRRESSNILESSDCVDV